MQARGYILILSLIILCSIAQASGAGIPDSLQSRLDTIVKTEDKLNFLRDQARKHIKSDSTLAFELNKLQKKFADASGDPKFIAKATLEKGILHAISGNILQARKLYLEVLPVYLKLNDTLNIGYVQRNIGLTYSDTEEKDSAVYYFYESIKSLDANHKDQKLFYALAAYDLAKMFYQTSVIDKSIEYATQALPIFEELKDTYNIAGIYNLMGLNMMNQTDSSSIVWIEKAMHFSDQINDSAMIAAHRTNYGIYLGELGKYNESLKVLKESYSIFQRHPGLNFEPYILMNLGKAYFHVGQYAKAEEYLLAAIKSNPNQGPIFPLSYAYHVLYSIKVLQKDYKKALEYLELYHKYKIQTITLSSLQEVNALESDIALKNKSKDLANLEKLNASNEETLKQKRIQGYILMSALAMMILLLLPLIYFYRKSQAGKQLLEKRNKAIEEQSHALEASNRTKDLLFSIISHDLRSPAGNVFMLLNLLPGKNDSLSAGSMEILNATKVSVIDFRNLLENLLMWAKSQQDGIKLLKEKLQLKSIVARVISGNDPLIANKHLQVITEGNPDIKLWADSSSLEIVLRNLLSNAIKYSPEYTSIHVKWYTEADQAVIVIEDEAGGIPEEVKSSLLAPKTDEVTVLSLQGLGLKLCSEFVRKNDGYWTINNTPKGTRFMLYFKDATQQASVESLN
jgi:signal transduction histidine kinase